MMVRPPQSPSQHTTLLHHRPTYSAAVNTGHPPAPQPPPPYTINSPEHNNIIGSNSTTSVHNNIIGSNNTASVTPSYIIPGVDGTAPATYQLTQVPAAAATAASSRQVLVRPPPATVQQQQMLPQQSGSTSPTVVSSMGNVVKNSPLLVGLLQQPDQQQVNKSPTGGLTGSPELGLASTHLTSLAANHYTGTVHHHRQINASAINQYSSTTRSKDGLTTHQQVYSGGSVITNARVPVAGGLQQHPLATGKPPPMVVGLQAGTQPGLVINSQKGLPPPPAAGILSRNNSGVVMHQQHHQLQQVVHSSASVMHQAPVLPQRSLGHNVASAASPSPTISPTPSLPSPHSSIPSSTGVSQAVNFSGSFIGSNHVTALTPPLTPSNQQVLSMGAAPSAHNVASSIATASTVTSDVLSSNIQADSAALNSTSLSNLQTSADGNKITKAPSPKTVSGSSCKESQYLINPNTGLLEPRHNTDSSDSDSESPPQQKLSQHLQQAQSKANPSVSLKHKPSDSLPLQPPKTKSPDQMLPRLQHPQHSTEDSRANAAAVSGLVSSSVVDSACERPGSHESTASSASSSSSSNSSVGNTGKDSLLQDVSRIVPCAALVHDNSNSGSRFSSNKAKEDSIPDDRIVRSLASGEIRLKFKLGREQVTQKTISSNANKKCDRKDLVISTCSSQSSSEQRVVPKLHIKFGSSSHVIVKPVPEDKDKNRKISDRNKDDRKRKGNRKRSRNSECESEKLEIMKLKESNVLKISDLKKAKLDLDSEEGNSYRGKDCSDGRSKAPRTYEDKFSHKLDNVKIAKFDAKLRSRPKIKAPLRKLGGINNLGELTSHKILETLPPSITKVAAMHTQQPHRNPSSSSSGSYFTSDSNLSSSHHRLDSELLGIGDGKDDSPPTGLRTTGGLMNGDLSHAERGALSRSLQSSTFSELTAGGKLTIKRKATEHFRATSSSLSLLKKAGDTNKRKMGRLIYIKVGLLVIIIDIL